MAPSRLRSLARHAGGWYDFQVDGAEFIPFFSPHFAVIGSYPGTWSDLA